MGSRILRGLAALTLAGGCAAYGFLAHKHRLFPYQLGHRIVLRLTELPPGFRKARPDARAAVTAEEINKLANTPYLRGYPSSAAGSGVLVQDRARMQPGWSLFTSGHAPVATLMGSDGRVARTWTTSAAAAFPSLVIPREPEQWDAYFSTAHLYPDGGVLAMFSHIGLVRLDVSSRVVWAYPSYVHHDLDVTAEGTIWVLSKQQRLVPGLGQGEPVIDDFVEEVSPEGRLVRRISVLEALRQSDYAPYLAHVAPGEPDLLHTNSVRILDGSLAARSPVFRRGNLLLSMRHLDLVAVLDPDRGRIVWALSGQWHVQHAARLLPTGRMLLFDNFGTMRQASRILEFDPFTQEVVWSWGGKAGEDLFSETNGQVERLDNGNTLICETNFGRAVEVTREGRIVWEFINPNRAGKKNELIAALYSIQRVPEKLAFLAESAAP